MAKIMCVPCSVEFESDAVYLKHKKSGHTEFLDQSTPLDSPPIPTPLVPQEAMLTPELVEMINRIDGKDKAPEEPSKASQHPSELPKAAPLVLEYIWKGEHEKCRRQPSTLKLEVGGKFFSVAYCESCKEQLESREVTKL